MPGLISPEKLVFTNKEFHTMQPNEIITLLCNGGKGSGKDKIEKSPESIGTQSCVVTAIGFKPITF